MPDVETKFSNKVFILNLEKNKLESSSTYETEVKKIKNAGFNCSNINSDIKKHLYKLSSHNNYSFKFTPFVKQQFPLYQT